MTKLTSYQKMNRSRNVSFVVLVVFLFLVAGKIIMTKEIQNSYQKYYANKISKFISESKAVNEIVTEGNRQLGKLEKFSIDTGWLKNVLDQYLLKTK